MDPDFVAYEISAALSAGNKAYAARLADDLTYWLLDGGYRPTEPANWRDEYLQASGEYAQARRHIVYAGYTEASRAGEVRQP